MDLYGWKGKRGAEWSPNPHLQVEKVREEQGEPQEATEIMFYRESESQFQSQLTLVYMGTNPIALAKHLALWSHTAAIGLPQEDSLQGDWVNSLTAWNETWHAIISKHVEKRLTCSPEKKKVSFCPQCSWQKNRLQLTQTPVKAEMSSWWLQPPYGSGRWRAAGMRMPPLPFCFDRDKAEIYFRLEGIQAAGRWLEMLQRMQAQNVNSNMGRK